jgi:alpha-mannosidase
MYIRKQLEEIWRDVLLNQFHDVLPGTSIKLVVEDALAIYETRYKQAKILLEDVLIVLFPNSGAANGVRPSISSEDDSQLIVVDPIRAPRTQLVEINHDSSDLLPSEIAKQKTADAVLALCQTDSVGLGQFINVPLSAPFARQEGDLYSLGNTQYTLTWEEGRLASLYDVDLERELIVPGPGVKDAGLVIYEDYPLAYDAWDAEIYHLDCASTVVFDKFEIIENGPLRASIKAIANWGNSVIALTVR